VKEPIHLSAHATLVALAALAIGLADASLVASSKLGAAGFFQYIPLRLWAVAPLCWLAAALALAVPSYAISRNRGAVLTVIAMIGLLLAVRFYGQPLGRIAVASGVMIIAAAVVWPVGTRWLASPKRVAAVFSTVAFMVLAVIVGAGITEPKRLPRLKQDALPNGKPDIVIVFLDTVEYDAIFPHGTNVDPQFRFLARFASRSVVFDRAYTSSPWTLPAHFSAVTGAPAHRLGIGFNHQHYDGGTATLAQEFRRRGYRTAAVVSNAVLNRGTGFARGFETYEYTETALDVCRTAPGSLLDRWCPWFRANMRHWNAREVTRRAIADLASNDDRPLFLLLNFMDAHWPYYTERGWLSHGNPLLEVESANYRQRYYASHLAAIRCIDDHLSELEARLQQRKRGTIIAILADHGEQFGEHGLLGHGNSLYDRLLHVPLMIEAPGIAPYHVSAPTPTEVLPELVMHVADRGRADTSTRAVVGSLVGPDGRKESWSIIRDSWHLLRSGNEVQLYDLSSDSAELRSLVGSPAAASLVRELSAELAQESRSRVDPRSSDFRSLGYVH